MGTSARGGCEAIRRRSDFALRQADMTNAGGRREEQGGSGAAWRPVTLQGCATSSCSWNKMLGGCRERLGLCSTVL